MLAFKGIYEWKLIDAETGRICDEGSEENLINDDILRYVVNDGNKNWRFSDFRIVLANDPLPIPDLEYRAAGVAASTFNRIASGGLGGVSIDHSLNKLTRNTNFNPPGSPRTITIIGVDFRPDDSVSTSNFISFVVLSTPITQQTNQYLYVQYSLFVEYLGGGVNSPSNDYVRGSINEDFMDVTSKLLAVPGTATELRAHITPFPPLSSDFDINKLGLLPFYTTNFGTLISSPTPQYGQRLRNDLSQTSYIGPIGSVFFGRRANVGVYTYRAERNVCLGYAPTANALEPSISRIFVHPYNRTHIFFNDASYPPDSQGVVSVTGVNSSPWTMVGRAFITKTGDASDIVDEHFTGTASTDTLSVNQLWNEDDIVRVTGLQLPAGLNDSTDYFIRDVTSSTVKVSTSEGGSPVNLTSHGHGFLKRQITGKYALEMQPYLHTSTNDRRQMQLIPQSVFYIDGTPNVINKIMYSDDYYNYGDDIFASVKHIDASGTAWVYNIEYFRSLPSSKYAISRWRFGTAEPSFALHEINGDFRRVTRGYGTYEGHLYIVTDTGIYDYDMNSPLSAPSSLSISGLYSSDMDDATMDRTTEYLWIGHWDGALSKVDLGTLTATTYTSAGALSPITDIRDRRVGPGMLQVHNSRVIRAGHTYWRYRSTDHYGSAWVMDDGYPARMVLNHPYDNYALAFTLQKSTGHLVLIRASGRDFQRYVIPWGTGSAVKTEDVSAWRFYNLSTHLVEIGENEFHAVVREESGFNPGADDRLLIYKDGSITTYARIETSNRRNWRSGSYGVVGSSHEIFDISNGHDVRILRAQSCLFYRQESTATKKVLFGWTGGQWLRNYRKSIPYGYTGLGDYVLETGGREIPETGVHELLDNTVIKFNNATGKDWDQQFVVDERFTFLYGPVPIKDDLQEYRVDARWYYCDARQGSYQIAELESTILTVPEQLFDSDFRDMDTLDLMTHAYVGITGAETGFYGFTGEAGLTGVYGLTGGVGITGLPAGSSPPGPGEYYAHATGFFEFNAAEVGKPVAIDYIYTLYT